MRALQKERDVWKNMIRKCSVSSHQKYKYYGGRGITVSAGWLDFGQFMKDLGPRPNGFTLERINNSKGYSAENCKWASWTEQANNTRRNSKHAFKGKTLTIAQWGRETGIKASTISLRLNKGWSVEDALSTPVGQDRDPMTGLFKRRHHV